MKGTKILIFFIVCFSCVCNAAIFKTFFFMGSYEAYFIYNNETLATDKIALVKIDTVLQKVYFVAVNEDATTKNIACRRISQTQVIVGPNGCSSPLNPAAAIQSSNCIDNEVDAQKRLVIFNEAWFLSQYDYRCKALGGDKRTCIGPAKLALDNQPSYIPKPNPTGKELLAARMIYVSTLMGPYAMMRGIVQMPVKMPNLRFITTNTTCLDFNQSYIQWGKDPYTDMQGNIWMAFKGTNTTSKRVLLKRLGSDSSVNFQIVLGDSAAAAGNYDLEYASNTIYGAEGDTLLITRNWIELIEYNTPYYFSNYTTEVQACVGYFIIEEQPSPFILEDLYPLTSQNYSKNALPRVYMKTRICGYINGRTDSTGNLVFSNVLAGGIAGGHAVFASPQYPNLRYHVPANPFLSFDLSCENRYSPNETFLDYGSNGIVNRNWIPRIDFVSEICNYPFIVPELVTINVNPNEKYNQCFLKGGWLAASGSYCSIGITQVQCKRPFVLFGSRCIYKFNPTTETKYTAGIDTAAIKCSILNPYALPVIEADIYLDAWIKNEFLKLNLDLNNFAMYRVPQYQSDRCTCYSTLTQTKITDCGCYDLTTASGLPIFPICYYPYNTPEMEPEYWDVSMSLQTAKVLVYGQEGPKPNGLPALCSCFDGNAGDDCERDTCMLKSILLLNPNELTEKGVFFRKCYTDGHGTCYNDNPSVCDCDYPFAPNAAILPQFPSLYQFRNFPCAFAAAVQRESLYFEIEGIFYPSSGPDALLPCSGISQGSGIVSNATNIGKCLCKDRINPITNVMEKGFSGDGCACENAVIPFAGISKNGIIIATLCNGRGTCCPTGQSISNPIFGDVSDRRCFDPITYDPLSGCVGDNGWGGESSTCPVPFDFALDKSRNQITYGGTTFTYVDLGTVIFVRYIRIRACETQTSVQISNDPGVDILLCPFNSTSQLYECPETLARRFVVLVGSNSLECYVQAYDEMFQYCGANDTINPFAGTFFNIPLYRSNFINEFQQYAGIATFGCTNTDCKCGPNNGNEKCRTAVSSIRETTIQVDGLEVSIYAKRYCGEEILVPALENPYRSRGYIDDLTSRCACNSISNVDATGRIGRVTEKFTGKACPCFDVFNSDTKEIMECAGHGFCEEASFGYGRCEYDIDEFVADALFTPFTVITDVADDYVDVIFTEDSYVYGDFIYETLSPTTRPTINPTVPTPKPTSISPTPAPTIIIYGIPTTQGGNLGDRDTTTASCYTRATQLSLACSDTPMLLHYTYSPIADFPTEYSFSPTIALVSPSNTYIGNWDTAIVSPGTISTTLNAAGIISQTQFWSGYATTTPTVQNCFDWTTTSNLEFGIFGSGSSTSWLPYTAGFCNGGRPKVCLCMPGSLSPTRNPGTGRPTTSKPTTRFPTTSPTKNPTVKPTKLPSKNPTRNPTQNPTIPIESLIFFDGGVFDDGNYAGGSGGRAIANARCQTVAPLVGLTDCRDSFMMLEYDYSVIGDFPTIYTFSPTVPIYSISGTQIASSWASAISGTLTNSLATAGVFSSGVFYFTGFQFTVAGNCINWQSASGSQIGERGSSDDVDINWIGAGIGSLCNTFLNRLCACSRTSKPTKSPTKSPTTKTPSKAPTKNPTTKSPTTKSPTKDPTKNPTKNPTTLSPTSLSPSKLPTKNPTLNPTHSPYISTFDIIVFSQGTGNGNIGSRSASSQLCATQATSLSLSCKDTPMLLDYTYSPIASFPTDYIFTTSSNLYSTSFQLIGQWSTALGPTPSVTTSLCTAGVLPCTSNWWSGYNSIQKCNDWTSSNSLDVGRTGRSEITNQGWISFTNINCDTTSVYRLCLCIPYTQSPTKKPTTLSPTNPTTKSPTQFTITKIVLYDSNSVTDGILGNRASVNAICASRATTLGLTCVNTAMLIDYFQTDIQTFPTQYSFDSFVPLYSTTNVLIANSWTDAVTNGNLVSTLQDAGVFAGFTLFYTGYNYGNTPIFNCLTWTSNSATSQFAYIGQSNKLDSWWIKNPSEQLCANTFTKLCICTQN